MLKYERIISWSKIIWKIIDIPTAEFSLSILIVNICYFRSRMLYCKIEFLSINGSDSIRYSYSRMLLVRITNAATRIGKWIPFFIFPSLALANALWISSNWRANFCHFLARFTKRVVLKTVSAKNTIPIILRALAPPTLSSHSYSM